MEKRTTKPEYIQPILDSLQNLGSTTRTHYIVVKDHLHPADHVVLSNGEQRWRYQMQHMIDGLIESGIIVKKSGLLTLCENLRS